MINVVKIGGNVVDNPEALRRFICDFAKIEGKKILVHGGGKEASRLSEALGIKTTMIDGRRVTDGETIEVVTMVYAGLINKRIVSMLQNEGVDALGLCGADGKALISVRRNPKPVDYGFVGDVDADSLNKSFVGELLDKGITPVFCAITLGADGALLNTNADSVASAVATGMAKNADTELTYCFEKAGVLMNPDDDTSVIPHINAEEFERLKAAGIVSKGMIPKLTNAFKALEKGVKAVTIKSADNVALNIGTRIE